MSDKLSMPAVDTVRVKVQLKARTFVRLENMSNKGHVSMSALCSALLDEATSDVDLSKKDLARVDRIIADNVARREEKKARKGIK